MIKLLPYILIPVLIVGGLGYFRFVSIKQSITPVTQNSNSVEPTPVEVPKTLPKTPSLPTPSPSLSPVVNTSSQLGSKVTELEVAITDLKARISILEKPTEQIVSSSKSTTYIPLGAGGSWDYSTFTTLTDYQINLDPANFSGYVSVVLEVIFRVVDSTSTTTVRLYNTSDNIAASPEVSTSTSSFTLASSSTFKLASGSKTYALQAKNGKTFYIQLARLRVNY